MRDLVDFRSIHLIGAGGSGMSSLAKLLAQMGHVVSGSDLKPGRALDALGDLGITTWVGHKPERAAAADLVVASSAVPSGDPEVKAAREAGVDVWIRPDLLDAMTRAMPAIGLSGTHGKTTSTALMVTALRAANLDPSFIIGGELVASQSGAHLGSPDWFVLEADEAFQTVTRIHMRGLLVSNIGTDHLDHYGPDPDALQEAFRTVMARVDGPVVVCADDPAVMAVAPADAITYGTAPDAMWHISSIVHGDWAVTFALVGPAGTHSVTIPQPGDHIARNAAGVVALASSLGVDPATAASGLAAYAGVKRRFEVRGRVGGVTVVDDYAHHPTEVAATIDAARLGSWRKVWAVFQPHLYSRTVQHAGAFASALSRADRVVVTDVFPSRESPIPGVTGKMIADGVGDGPQSVDYVPALRDIPGFVASGVGEGDLVLVLGAGDVTSQVEPLIELLGER